MADESHMDKRLTVEQGMEMFGIQFEMGCDHTVCVDVLHANCMCMDELQKQFPELAAKRHGYGSIEDNEAS